MYANRQTRTDDLSSLQIANTKSQVHLVATSETDRLIKR